MSREWFRRVFSDATEAPLDKEKKRHPVRLIVGEPEPECMTREDYPMGFDSIEVGTPVIEPYPPPRRRR